MIASSSLSVVDYDDLLDYKAGNIGEDEVMECLEARYKVDRISTLIGDVLVTVNPFKPVPATLADYQGKISRPEIMRFVHYSNLTLSSISNVQHFQLFCTQTAASRVHDGSQSTAESKERERRSIDNHFGRIRSRKDRDHEADSDAVNRRSRRIWSWSLP